MIVNIPNPVNLHELSQQYGVDKYDFFVSPTENDKIMILYGDSLQDGIVGFGNTTEEAIKDFDRNWKARYGNLDHVA
jgi:hypothetical protein